MNHSKSALAVGLVLCALTFVSVVAGSASTWAKTFIGLRGASSSSVLPSSSSLFLREGGLWPNFMPCAICFCSEKKRKVTSGELRQKRSDLPQRKSHLQISDFIRDVFLGHAVIQMLLFRLGYKDAVVRESSRSDGIPLPVGERQQCCHVH